LSVAVEEEGVELALEWTTRARGCESHSSMNSMGAFAGGRGSPESDEVKG
jgi:hypothetical protein